jgi:UDP-glucose 4-epimerase
MGRRILVTGLDSFWGGRVAQVLEREPDVELVLGMGTGTPTVELDRTEYVRADQSYSLLSRIVRATRVDTVVHTFLVVDSTRVPGRRLHETNVIGTMNLLAAAGGTGSSVRHVVVKSSTLVYGAAAEDPTWFTEDMHRSGPPRTRVERSLLEVEDYVRDFALDNPGVVVALARFANVLGERVTTPISRNLSRGLLPVVAGFDPLVQFVEEDDVVACLVHLLRERVAGTFNVAGAGRIPWSEVAAIAGVRRLPLPPLATSAVAAPLVRAGLLDLPPELEALLRYGRGVDTSRLERTGFRFRYTSAGTVRRFARARNLRRAVGDHLPAYTYDADVEAFFQHSPAVVRGGDASSSRARS